MTDKCGHCPLASEDRHCPGQYNPRACGLPADRLRRAQGPGLLRKVANFAGAVAEHVAAGMPVAPEDVKASRLAICRANTCGFYGEGDRCLHSGCGCYLTVKTAWAGQSCPLDPPLWGPVPVE